MIREPPIKRVVAFFDGQNLYHSAKKAFGHKHPNYDPVALTGRVAAEMGWEVVGVRFYTGVPDEADDPFWNHFWNAKFAQLGREGVHVFRRPLRYRDKRIVLPDGSVFVYRDGDEKGIDVRIAVDVIRLANENAYDVALLFSQDQDFSEVAHELRVIARTQGRWIKIASAFPRAPTKKARGIDRTDWIPIDADIYDMCLDSRNYRPKRD